MKLLEKILEENPQKIEKLRSNILKLQQQKLEIEEKIRLWKNEKNEIILNDSSLKNDKMRNLALENFKNSSEDYKKLEIDLKTNKLKIDKNVIKLQKLIDEQENARAFCKIK